MSYRLLLRHIARDAIDRAEALARAADLHGAGFPQRLGLPQVHHPRPRTHEVMRLVRALRSLHQHFYVFQHATGMAELAVVAGVRAVDDGRDALAVVHDRHRVRHVDGIVAVAPGVERVAVAGDAAD